MEELPDVSQKVVDETIAGNKDSESNEEFENELNNLHLNLKPPEPDWVVIYYNNEQFYKISPKLNIKSEFEDEEIDDFDFGTFSKEFEACNKSDLFNMCFNKNEKIDSFKEKVIEFQLFQTRSSLHFKVDLPHAVFKSKIIYISLMNFEKIIQFYKNSNELDSRLMTNLASSEQNKLSFFDINIREKMSEKKFLDDFYIFINCNTVSLELNAVYSKIMDSIELKQISTNSVHKHLTMDFQQGSQFALNFVHKVKFFYCYTVISVMKYGQSILAPLITITDISLVCYNLNLNQSYNLFMKYYKANMLNGSGILKKPLPKRNVKSNSDDEQTDEEDEVAMVNVVKEAPEIDHFGKSLNIDFSEEKEKFRKTVDTIFDNDTVQFHDYWGITPISQLDHDSLFRFNLITDHVLMNLLRIILKEINLNENEKDYYIMSPFFSDLLKSSTDSEQFFKDHVSYHFKKETDTPVLFGKEYVFIPICYNDHWVLMMFYKPFLNKTDTKGGEFFNMLYFDSYYGLIDDRFINNMYSRLVHYFINYRQTYDKNGLYEFTNIRRGYIKTRVQQQINALYPNMCGYFVLRFIRYLLKNKKIRDELMKSLMENSEAEIFPMYRNVEMKMDIQFAKKLSGSYYMKAETQHKKRKTELEVLTNDANKVK